MLLLDCSLYRPYSWLLCRARILIVAIEVLGHGVETVITAIYAIWVQHRYNLEYKSISQHLGLCAVLVREKFPNTSQDERGWSLTGVNAGGDEYCGLLVKLERPGRRITACLRE